MKETIKMIRANVRRAQRSPVQGVPVEGVELLGALGLRTALRGARLG